MPVAGVEHAASEETAMQPAGVDQPFDCDKMGLDWLLPSPSLPIVKQEVKVSQQNSQENPLINLFFSELGASGKLNATTSIKASPNSDNTTPSTRYFLRENDSLWM